MSAARFTLDLAAWDAGFAAGGSRPGADRQPYPKGSNESLSWHSGFIEGKAARPRRSGGAAGAVNGVPNRGCWGRSDRVAGPA
jgi:hypothetical protein